MRKARQRIPSGRVCERFLCSHRNLANFDLANFANSLYSLNEPLLVAEMTPVVHYVS